MFVVPNSEKTKTELLHHHQHHQPQRMNLLVIFVCVMLQVEALSKPQFYFPSQSFFPSQQPPIPPAQPPAPAPRGIEATISGSSDKLCGLLDFADTKCPSRSKDCKKCVIDQLTARCPFPASGKLDCDKQKSCATAQSFTCPQ